MSNPTGLERSPRMPRAAYAQLERQTRNRAQYRATVRAATRRRRARALWWLAVLLMLTAGIAGLVLTKPIPGIG